MKSLEEISDRMEIQDLLVTYSHAVDFQRWDELDAVFVDEAIIDFTVFGGPRGTYREIKEYLRLTMPMFASYYHLAATSKITIDGDTGTGVTICHNPMVLPRPNGGQHIFVCGLWYHDLYVRTDAGWRISERIEQKSFVDNMPDGMGVTQPIGTGSVNPNG